MNVEDRVRICLESGCSGEEIKVCVREVRSIQERMLQNIYGASPFEEVQEKWNSFTEQVNMAGIVAAKKFTRLWRKKTRERKEKAMAQSEKDEITATAGHTPVKVPGLTSTIVSDTDSSELRDSNLTEPESNSSSDKRPVSSNLSSLRDHASPTFHQPIQGFAPKRKSILKRASPKETEKKMKGDDESITAEEIKVDLKNFAKSTIKTFKRASKIKFGSSNGDDDSSTFSADIEASMEASLDGDSERVSWSTFGSKKKEGEEEGEPEGPTKKDCTIS
ncbi:hypothetical protein TL16_g03260 [Triparma laevis f. inornata]|nr:hypothetical protein TL16_g03260 [Triparma laevis f. inornata]